MNIAFIVIAQFFAILTFFFSVLSTESIEKKKVLLYNGIANLTSVIQYILLGAWTGALGCLLAILRNLVFKKYKVVPTKVMIIYLVLICIISAPTIKSFVDFLPLFNIIIYTIGLAKCDVKTLKIITIITCFTGLIYNLVYYAFVGVLTACIEAVTSTLAYIKLIRKKRLVLQTAN